MKKYLVVIFVVFFLQSCEDNKVVYKPESSARINSITVVVDNDNWNNTIGDKIRKLDILKMVVINYILENQK